MNKCKANVFKKVTHVIFDMDGVLLDTERLYTQATQNIVSKYNKTFTWEIKHQLMGLTGQESAKKIVQLLDIPLTPEEYYELAKAELELLFQHSELMPGVPELLKHLHSHHIPMAVATSSSDASYQLKVRPHLELFKLFHHIVCGGSDPEVKHGKPHPDIFLICASRFPNPPRPDQCLVFEDAPNGVKSAIAAGMQVIMLPDENIPPELRKDAHIVINRLDEAPLELFGLPRLEK